MLYIGGFFSVNVNESLYQITGTKIMKILHYNAGYLG